MREITAGPSSPLGKPSSPQTSMSGGTLQKSADSSQAELSGFFRKEIGTFPLFEIALVFVRFDHVANVIVNADHSIMCVSDERSSTRKLGRRCLNDFDF